MSEQMNVDHEKVMALFGNVFNNSLKKTSHLMYLKRVGVVHGVNIMIVAFVELRDFSDQHMLDIY